MVKKQLKTINKKSDSNPMKKSGSKTSKTRKSDKIKKFRSKVPQKHKKHLPVKEPNDETIDIDNADVQDIDDFASEGENEVKPKKIELGQKIRDRLKKKIIEWLDSDDKIKELNARVKKYKDAKKEQEQRIMTMFTNLGIENEKLDIHDDNDNLRSRVYRYKSETRGAIKEDIIKSALMEVIRNEKRVDELVKKIENKRPINLRYYLKRTKGNKDK